MNQKQLERATKLKEEIEKLEYDLSYLDKKDYILKVFVTYEWIKHDVNRTLCIGINNEERKGLKPFIKEMLKSRLTMKQKEFDQL